MKESQSGSALPTGTYTWPIANQAIAAATSFAPAAIAVPGVRVGNCVVKATARAALPQTAGAAAPSVEVFCNANDQVTLRVSNPSAAALVATAADIVFDIMAFPLRP
jgi:hypothetical protein